MLSYHGVVLNQEEEYPSGYININQELLSEGELGHSFLVVIDGEASIVWVHCFGVNEKRMQDNPLLTEHCSPTGTNSRFLDRSKELASECELGVASLSIALPHVVEDMIVDPNCNVSRA